MILRELTALPLDDVIGKYPWSTRLISTANEYLIGNMRLTPSDVVHVCISKLDSLGPGVQKYLMENTLSDVQIHPTLALLPIEGSAVNQDRNFDKIEDEGFKIGYLQNYRQVTTIIVVLFVIATAGNIAMRITNQANHAHAVTQVGSGVFWQTVKDIIKTVDSDVNGAEAPQGEPQPAESGKAQPGQLPTPVKPPSSS